MGNANSLRTLFCREIGVKKPFLFLILAVLLALPLACENRAFNEPISPLLAPTPTPTPAWGYQDSAATPTATP